MSHMGHVIIRDARMEVKGDGVIIRGMVDLSTLRYIMAAPYQREVLEGKHVDGLIKAIASGEQFQDLDLAMRGEDYFQDHDGSVILRGPVYVNDGLQRKTALERYWESYRDTEIGVIPSIGAMVFVNSTEKSERKRFEKVNTNRARVSANIFLLKR